MNGPRLARGALASAKCRNDRRTARAHFVATDPNVVFGCCPASGHSSESGENHQLIGAKWNSWFLTSRWLSSPSSGVNSSLPSCRPIPFPDGSYDPGGGPNDTLCWGHSHGVMHDMGQSAQTPGALPGFDGDECPGRPVHDSALSRSGARATEPIRPPPGRARGVERGS